MVKEDILELIEELNKKQSETISIEAKSAKSGVPERYYDTISSFSNTLGGVILFGVEEIKKKGKTVFEVVGVDDVNELQKNITNLCSKEFEPVIRPEIDVVNIEKKKIVSVRIEMLSARFKPCYYKPKGLHKGSYIRVGDRDDNMTEYEIYKCISYKENTKDDLRAVTRATLNDLDQKLIEKFIVNAKIDKPKFAEFSDEEILLQHGVLTQIDDKIFPTVAGIMVFGIYPQKFFPQWFVAAIVIPGFEVANLGEIGQRFDDNKRIEGNIVEMYQETIGFISRNMKVKVIISDKTGLRTDITQYPMDALREAIANMIIHRDYSDLKTGVYSIVTIYRDRIEFRNVGNLYGSNTLELLKTRKAMEVRNETIVKLLEILGGIIENRHTGISTMEDKMKEAKLPEPVFTNEREDFVVTFYNGEYPELYPEELGVYQNIKASDKASDKILEYLKQNEYITTKIASELLNLSPQRVRVILSRMSKDNFIIAKGANRNRKYIANKF